MTALLFDYDILRYPFISQGKGLEKEKALLLGVVSDYDAILSDFYATDGVPALLNRFPATKSIRHALFKDIGFLRDRDLLLVYDLAEITPVNVRITSYRTAEVVVFEEWNYLYQRLKDRKQISKLKGMGRGFLYRLKRESGAWVVWSFDTLPVEEPRKKGEFLF